MLWTRDLRLPTAWLLSLLRVAKKHRCLKESAAESVEWSRNSLSLKPESISSQNSGQRRSPSPGKTESAEPPSGRKDGVLISGYWVASQASEAFVLKSWQPFCSVSEVRAQYLQHVIIKHRARQIVMTFPRRLFRRPVNIWRPDFQILPVSHPARLSIPVALFLLRVIPVAGIQNFLIA